MPLKQTSANAFVDAILQSSEFTHADANSDDLLTLASNIDSQASLSIIDDLFAEDLSSLDTPQGDVFYQNLDTEPTLFHLTFPIYVTAFSTPKEE